MHTQVYLNIYSLTLCYPSTEDFKRVFARDMFIKNNKTAFHQVIYYLLSILDPETIKVKIQSWPIYTPKREAQFRREVITYVKELIAFYEYPDMPLLMASHLISPGGYRFTLFILKLSQMVITVQLRKHFETNIYLLFPISCNKDSSITKRRIDKLKEKVSQIELETVYLHREVDNYVKMARSDASAIKHEKQVVKKKLEESKIRLSKGSVQTKICPINVFIPNESLTTVVFVLSLCSKIEELCSYLFKNQIILKNNTTGSQFCVVGNELNFTIYLKRLTSINLQKTCLNKFLMNNMLAASSETNALLLILCKIFEKLQMKSLELSIFNKNV